jgi:hypothetical protein
MLKMSLSDSNQNVRTYPVIASAQSQVPQELMSSSAPRPLASKVQHKVANCQTATQNAGGQLMFNLGCGAGQGFLKSGSVYLTCTIKATQAINAANKWKFANSNGLASAVILRDTLYCNGNIADQYNYVNKLRQSLVSHCSTEGYVRNDLAITEAPLDLNVSNPAEVSVKVCIPVQNGALNAQHNLPLFLLNTCQIEFNLDTASQAFFAVAAVVSDYVVSDAKITYSVIQPEVAFEQEMRSILASGKLFQMPIKSWYNLKQSNANATKSVSIGLNMSSVNAVFHSSYKTTGDGLQALYNTSDGPSSLRVWCDGELKNSFPIDSAPVIFNEMKKALGVFGDPERSSANINTLADPSVSTPLTQTNYLTQAFLGGLSLLRTQESGFEMSGTPVSQMIVEVTNTGTAGSDLYIYVSYSQILCIDGQGSIQLIR